MGVVEDAAGRAPVSVHEVGRRAGMVVELFVSPWLVWWQLMLAAFESTACHSSPIGPTRCI